jgi:uncharacterized protein YkwD
MSTVTTPDRPTLGIRPRDLEPTVEDPMLIAATLRLRLTSLATVLVVAGTLLAVPNTAAPAEASSCTLHKASEREAVDRVNGARSHRSIRTLTVNTQLRTVARDWSKSMCSRGKLEHNPKLGRQVENWRVVGENVGRGGSIRSIHTAFMGSDGHKRNILDTRFREVGIGVYRKPAGGGYTYWQTQVYRQSR